MMNSLIKAINPLKLIVSDPNNQVSDDTKNRLLSYGQHKDFIDDMKQLVSILQPVSDCIHRIEGNSESIAAMVEQVSMLSHITSEVIPNLRVHRQEVQKFFDTYIAGCKTPSAVLANTLHPLFFGLRLRSDDKTSADSFLKVFIAQLDMKGSEKEIMKSYDLFVTKDGYFKNDFLWCKDRSDAIRWWKFVRVRSDHKMLAELALRLLHIQPTNTAVERTFSSQKFIHRKERNRLAAHRVHRLMFIYTNLNTFDNDSDFSMDDIVLESDSEDEQTTQEDVQII